MSKGKNPWQRFLQFGAARMHEDVDDDRLDRAVTTASGRLPRNPKYVVESRTVCSDPHQLVLCGTISPHGQIALVQSRQLELNDAASDAEFTLLTWNEGEIRTKPLNTVICWDENVRILFPQGSDEPAVIIGSRHVIWGDWTFRTASPEGDDSHNDDPRDPQLLLWAQGNKKHGAFIEWRSEQLTGNAWVVTEHDQRKEAEEVRNLRLFGNDLACIQATKMGTEGLCWRGFPLRMTTDPQRSIVTDSLSFEPGRKEVVFLTQSESSTDLHACRVTQDGRITETPCPSPIVNVDDGNIFCIKQEERDASLMRFEQRSSLGYFDHVGFSTTHLNGLWVKNARTYTCVGSVVITNLHIRGKKVERHLCVVTRGYRPVALETRDICGISKMHYGLALECLNGTFHWEVYRADENYMPRADFPLYGMDFNRLTAVEDEHGKAIMNWSYIDGTLHVIRYPLPTRL